MNNYQLAATQPRRRSSWLIVTTIIVLAIAIPVGWWLVSPLLIDNTVDEAFPVTLPSAAEIAALPDANRMPALEAAMPAEATIAALSPEEQAAVEQEVQTLTALMPDQVMEDEMPAAAADEWVTVAQGEFTGADSFHQGSGTATIYQQGETRLLRLEEFSSTNGPDLHVLLVENVTGEDMGAYIDLGALKGNVGNQNYEIPADVDLSLYSGVMIYCQPFHVVFSTAPFGE